MHWRQFSVVLSFLLCGRAGSFTLQHAVAITAVALCLSGPHIATASPVKLAPALRQGIDRARRGQLAPFAGAVAGGRRGGQRRGPETGNRPALRVNSAGEAEVYLHLTCPADETLFGTLRQAGAVIERVNRRHSPLVQARVPLGSVERLATSACVERVTLPSYGRPRVGSVTTEGDAILRTDEVRTAPPGGFGFDGTGITVGTISGGVLGLSTAQGSGDLPGVTVLDAGCSDPSDLGCAEGTAMLEIIHDLAPGASLGFYGPRTSLDFCDAVSALESSFGAEVVVDDLGFFAEPYFEDGLVAQCVAAAVAAGVVYVSSAGNEAEAHYQGTYVDSGDGLGSHSIGPGNSVFGITGSQPLVFVQWSNPFGAAVDDYDLCLSSETQTECAGFNTQQDGDDDPLEIATLNCERGCNMQVRRVSGDPQTIELFVLDGSLSPSDQVEDDSVFGHPAVPGVLAVGAIGAHDPGNDTIESFSSRGDVTIFFPAFQTRAKPDITAIDGVSVTGAARFPSTFYGTSASAPHVAAIAALLLEANSGLTPADVANALAVSAVDLGAPGSDPTFGAGRADAFAAVTVALGGVPPTTVSTNSVTTSTTTTSTVTTTTLPQLIRAKRAAVTHAAAKPSKNAFFFVSNSSVATPGAGNEPTAQGAILHIRDGGGQSLTISLPASRWKGIRGGAIGYKYKDKKGRSGPCRRMVFKTGKRIRAACKGNGITLVPPFVEPVEVLLQMGRQGYCAAFGGIIKNNKNGRFVGKSAVAPTQCDVGG